MIWPGISFPGDIDVAMPTPAAFARQVIRRGLKALGIAYVKDMAWRARFAQPNLVKTELEKLVAEGEVCLVEIAGLKTSPLYMAATTGPKNQFVRRRFYPLTVRCAECLPASFEGFF
jgi:uncharacterized protein YcaQ